MYNTILLSMALAVNLLLFIVNNVMSLRNIIKLYEIAKN